MTAAKAIFKNKPPEDLFASDASVWDSALDLFSQFCSALLSGICAGFLSGSLWGSRTGTSAGFAVAAAALSGWL